MPLTIPSDLKLEIETVSIYASCMWFDAGCLPKYSCWGGLGRDITLAENALVPGDLINGHGSNRATFALRVLEFQFPKP